MSAIPPKAEVKSGAAIGNSNPVANDHPGPRFGCWHQPGASKFKLRHYRI
jgi:hypothetical protein